MNTLGRLALPQDTIINNYNDHMEGKITKI